MPALRICVPAGRSCWFGAPWYADDELEALHTEPREMTQRRLEGKKGLKGLRRRG